jgi:allophanate hydrolase
MPLFGIPFAIKDNIDCIGLPTTAGCPAFSYMPSRAATVVQRLVDAGAIPMGKTNLDQFATGLVGTRSPHGAPRSVFNKDYISGGSSSGSAVAVAAGLVSFALGTDTDTAGSGRVPAAFNNIVGLKPSRGLLSTRGVVPACRSLDCVSIFALDTSDAKAVFEVAAASDENDPLSRAAPVTQNFPKAGEFTFAVPRSESLQFFGDLEAERLYRRALMALEALGGKRKEIDFAVFSQAAALLYDGAFVAERYAAVGDFIEKHQQDVDPVVGAIILASKDRAAQLESDQHKLEMLKEKAAALLSVVDVMVLPTTPTIYRVSEIEHDPVLLNSRLGTYTNFMNLLDLCGVAIPAGIAENGLPYGITLAAPAFAERFLIEIATRFERASSNTPGAPHLAAIDWIDIAVVGAHMSGLPLNHELSSRGAQFQERTKTAPSYRLYALPGGPPFRPGLARVEWDGAAIELEIWRLPASQWGSFMAGVPQPLCVGTLELFSGQKVKGFLCETVALREAADITAYGGWRAYMASKAKS